MLILGHTSPSVPAIDRNFLWYWCQILGPVPPHASTSCQHWQYVRNATSIRRWELKWYVEMVNSCQKQIHFLACLVAWFIIAWQPLTTCNNQWQVPSTKINILASHMVQFPLLRDGWEGHCVNKGSLGDSHRFGSPSHPLVSGVAHSLLFWSILHLILERMFNMGTFPP